MYHCVFRLNQYQSCHCRPEYSHQIRIQYHLYLQIHCTGYLLKCSLLIHHARTSHYLSVNIRTELYRLSYRRYQVHQVYCHPIHIAYRYCLLPLSDYNLLKCLTSHLYLLTELMSAARCYRYPTDHVYSYRMLRPLCCSKVPSCVRRRQILQLLTHR